MSATRSRNRDNDARIQAYTDDLALLKDETIRQSFTGHVNKLITQSKPSSIYWPNIQQKVENNNRDVTL